MKKRNHPIWLFMLILVLIFSGCSQPDTITSSDYPEISPEADFAAEGTYSMAGEAGSYDTAANITEPAGQQQSKITPAPGILTAGEWNDNENFDFLKGLMATNQDWDFFSQQWEIALLPRISVAVTRGDEPFENVRIDLLDQSGNILWTTLSNNQGKAWLFKDIAKNGQTAEPAFVRATANEFVLEQPLSDSHHITFEYPAMSRKDISLDLMFVIDTTGSMGDELEYLKLEMENVIHQVVENNADIPVRLSVNVYRDIGDDYVVRPTPFTTNIQSQTAFLAQQSAAGGGDYEEAVELALRDAIYDHSWNPEATARLLFLVLDAPPHNTADIRREMKALAKAAAENGITIIPIASSGVDKNTEFLMRTLAVTTGGTYSFLTDHSGIGEAHLEPTIGEYQVEMLNDLMVRIIDSYLK